LNLSIDVEKDDAGRLRKSKSSEHRSGKAAQHTRGEEQRTEKQESSLGRELGVEQQTLLHLSHRTRHEVRRSPTHCKPHDW
jgi:hypothetical protein